MKEKKFHNPTVGELGFNQVINNLVKFIENEPKEKYNLVIGTDSHANGYGENKKLDFVSAIIIHRLGKGGRYFWQKSTKNKIFTLRQKIYQEAMFSLNLAQQLLEKFKNYLEPKNPKYNLEIHVDIGNNGETKEMIKEIVGMIKGNGFQAKTKPNSYGASTIADKYT